MRQRVLSTVRRSGRSGKAGFLISSSRRFWKDVVTANDQSTCTVERDTSRSFGMRTPFSPNRTGYSMDCWRVERAYSDPRVSLGLSKEIDSSAGRLGIVHARKSL